MFVTDDVAIDQARVDAGEMRADGPHAGRPRHASHRPTARPARWSSEALAAVGATREDFARAGRDLPGARRPVLVRGRPRRSAGVRVESDATALRLRFGLPSGSYATV